jgi:hypothetical protein
LSIAKFKISKTKTVGGSPTAGYFLLLRQNKVTKEKATQIRHLFEVPCVCSTGQVAAELALRAQTVLADIP